MKIGIVISSTRPNRIGPNVAHWVAAQAPEGVEVEIIDLAEVRLPFLYEPKQPSEGDYVVPSTQAWAERINGLDAVILTVAEYNGGYTAPLKNAIDSLYAEWNDKPVGLVGYGWGAGARAVNALTPVLETVKAERVDGPGLAFQTHLTLEGDILEAAPADEVAALYQTLSEKASVLV